MNKQYQIVRIWPVQFKFRFIIIFTLTPRWRLFFYSLYRRHSVIETMGARCSDRCEKGLSMHDRRNYWLRRFLASFFIHAMNEIRWRCYWRRYLTRKIYTISKTSSFEFIYFVWARKLSSPMHAHELIDSFSRDQ